MSLRSMQAVLRERSVFEIYASSPTRAQCLLAACAVELGSINLSNLTEFGEKWI